MDTFRNFKFALELSEEVFNLELCFLKELKDVVFFRYHQHPDLFYIVQQSLLESFYDMEEK